MINLGRFNEALQAFNRALELDPKLSVAYRYKGKLFALQGKWDTAISNYTRAIELRPNYALALAGRAYAYLELNKHKQGFKDMKDALALDSKDLDILATQASIKLRFGKVDECIQYCLDAISQEKRLRADKTIDHVPGDIASLYNLLGNAYGQKRRWKKALETYSLAIEANPYNAKCRTNRGYCFYRLGQVKKALEEFNQAIAIDPEFHRVYYNRATLYLSLKRYQEALKDLDKVISLNPPILDKAYAKRGEIKRDLNDLPGALQDFKLALAQNPKLYGVYANRGDVYLQMGKTREAIYDFEFFVEKMPQHPVAKLAKKQLPRLRASLLKKK